MRVLIVGGERTKFPEGVPPQWASLAQEPTVALPTLLARALEATGRHQAATVESGAEALDLLKQDDRPDAVLLATLLDLDMPPREFVAAARLASPVHLPIVVMSGQNHGFEDMDVQARVTKPSNPEEIVRKVEEAAARA